MSLRQNALVLASLTVLIAILGAWTADPVLAGAWRLPLALLLLGLAYERWVTSKAGVHADLNTQQTAMLGRVSALQLDLSHRLQRATRIELAAAAPQGVEVEPVLISCNVPSGAAARVQLQAVALRLGEHTWPDLRARIAGPLGLAWWAKTLPASFKLGVTPDMLGGDRERTANASSGPRAKSMLGSGAEVLQLREYRAGDPQHWIDWKASARTGRLISRDYSEDQHLDIVIALDAGRASGLKTGRLDRLGHYVNVAARFAEYAVSQDDRVGLIVFADRPLVTIVPGRGIAAVLRIRRALSAVTLAPAESNPLNAALSLRALARHRTLVVMLTDLDDATVAGQLASAARLLLPKHLPLIAGLSSPEAERLALSRARTWLEPYESLAAQEYCARLARNVHALRALGAPALLAPPEQLEQAVFHAYADFRNRRRV